MPAVDHCRREGCLRWDRNQAASTIYLVMPNAVLLAAGLLSRCEPVSASVCGSWKMAGSIINAPTSTLRSPRVPVDLLNMCEKQIAVTAV